MKQGHSLKYSVNSLWSIDATRWQRYGSTLTYVIACCLMAPSHYLNQCWIISVSCGIHLRTVSQKQLMNLIQNMCSKIVLFKNTTTFPRNQWVNILQNKWHLMIPPQGWDMGSSLWIKRQICYRQTSKESHTNSENLNVFRLILQLSLPNP